MPAELNFKQMGSFPRMSLRGGRERVSTVDPPAVTALGIQPNRSSIEPLIKVEPVTATELSAAAAVPVPGQATNTEQGHQLVDQPGGQTVKQEDNQAAGNPSTSASVHLPATPQVEEVKKEVKQEDPTEEARLAKLRKAKVSLGGISY